MTTGLLHTCILFQPAQRLWQISQRAESCASLTHTKPVVAALLCCVLAGLVQASSSPSSSLPQRVRPA